MTCPVVVPHPWFPGTSADRGSTTDCPARPAILTTVLPSGPPVQVGPGEVLVMIRDQAGVWHYAALAPRHRAA